MIQGFNQGFNGCGIAAGPQHIDGPVADEGRMVVDGVNQCVDRLRSPDLRQSSGGALAHDFIGIGLQKSHEFRCSLCCLVVTQSGSGIGSYCLIVVVQGVEQGLDHAWLLTVTEGDGRFTARARVGALQVADQNFQVDGRTHDGMSLSTNGVAAYSGGLVGAWPVAVARTGSKAVGVGLRVLVGVGVMVGVSLAVGVMDGVIVAVGVSLGVGVIEGVRVIVGVSLGVGLGPGVGLGVSTAMTVPAILVGVGGGVGLFSGVGSIPGPVSTVISLVVRASSTR